MNIHPIELALTRKLLKKAQEFRPLEPLSFGVPFADYALHPALVTELLPLIQRTSAEWIPALARSLMAWGPLIGARVAVPIDVVEAGLRMWAHHPVHQKTPVYLTQPPEMFVSQTSRVRPMGTSPLTDVDAARAEAVKSSWKTQLEALAPSANEQYRTMDPTLFMPELLDSGSIGVTSVNASIDRAATNPQSAVKIRTYPSILIKMDKFWPGTYLHELGHSVVPDVPVSMQGTTPYLQRFMHPELINAAFLLELAPAALKQIAGERATPFIIQALGQLFGRELQLYSSYLASIMQQAATAEQPSPYVADLTIGAVDQFKKKTEQTKRLRTSREPWGSLFAESYQNPSIQADMARQRRVFMNALNHLVAMAELAVQGQTRAEKAKLTDILKALQRLRESPTERELYEIALRGPESIEKTKEVLEQIVTKYPEARQTKAYDIIQRVMEPALFRPHK